MLIETRYMRRLNALVNLGCIDAVGKIRGNQNYLRVCGKILQAPKSTSLLRQFIVILQRRNTRFHSLDV